MFSKFLILFTIFILFFTACSSSETPNKPANTNTVNTTNINSANSNADNPIATTTATPAQTMNTAETVKPVVMAYYEALKTKNDAALRKVYSRETLMTLEKDAADAGKNSLVEFIVELEPVPAQPFEVRNEVVQGDTAIAEIRGGVYPNGIRWQFAKENGEWKLTNIIPDFEKPKQ